MNSDVTTIQTVHDLRRQAEPRVAKAMRGDDATPAPGAAASVDRPWCRRELGADVLSADDEIA